jgi:predicted Zn-dependent protease
MAATSERPNIPWQFGVVDDPTPNAFALPGGPIFLTRGMMTLIRSEAELASVLGHEIGHVTARHSVSSISQQQLAQIGLVAGGVLIPEIRPYVGLMGTGLSLLFLQHGREAERQADDLGFTYAQGRGYAMSEMADVFRALERLQTPERSALPTFLSSHPSPGERVSTLEAKAAALAPAERGKVVREEDYLRQIDGLVYGEDPRQGFFRDREFLHPDLRFRFELPSGWQGENMRNAVLAASPRGDAALQLTIANGSPDAAAQRFASNSGIVIVDSGRQNLNGMPTTQARFEATTQSGRLAGHASWISYGGRTYQLLTYTTSDAYPSYDRAFRNVTQSFETLRDNSVLNIRANRVAVVNITERQTLADFNRRQPSAVDIDELAVINDVAGPNAVLPPGTLVKRIVGNR